MVTAGAVLKRHQFIIHQKAAFCLGCSIAGLLREFHDWEDWADHIDELIESGAAE